MTFANTGGIVKKPNTLEEDNKGEILMKKLIASLLAAMLLLSLAACQPADSGKDQNKDEKFVIGICQLATHDALDSATKGFQDAVAEGLGAENVTFKLKDAAGEYTNCTTIVDGFVSENVDMILANATSPLQAANAATGEIPILGTSVTDYATALNIKEWTGTVGGNISGTTDLAPLDEQAAMILELFPDTKKVGMIYCSAEPNSVYQVDVVQKELEKKGITCERFAFNDVNDLASITQDACDKSDVIYIPTDNTAANNTETIANVVIPAKIPVVCGEANTCKGCGVATLSIDYYDLGYATGKMAVKILKGEAKISEMPVEAAPEFTKMYNKANCEELGIDIPQDYIVIE